MQEQVDSPGKRRALSRGTQIAQRAVMWPDPAQATHEASVALATYFARLAHLQAASADAFYILRDDLRAHGAPPRLVRGAERAAHDVIRHAARAARLASRFGGFPPKRTTEARSPRTLLAVALDNVVEGCVRETYGVAEANVQARGASDADIRAMMRAIARDEARHVALAWNIAAWIGPRLSVEEQRAVAEALGEAVRRLFEEISQEPDPAVQLCAGIPSTTEALRIARMLDAQHWHVMG